MRIESIPGGGCPVLSHTDRERDEKRRKESQRTAPALRPSNEESNPAQNGTPVRPGTAEPVPEDLKQTWKSSPRTVTDGDSPPVPEGESLLQEAGLRLIQDGFSFPFDPFHDRIISIQENR